MNISPRFLLLSPAIFWLSSVAAQVLPAQNGYDGRSASDLAAEWWQWAASAPAGMSPIRDPDGAHCGVGQRGGLWFLAGGFGTSKIHRRCAVPAGKALFFPIINMVYWPRQANNGYTCDAAKKNAAMNNDTALDLFAEIDGVAVENPKRFRIATQACFNLYGRLPAADRPYEAFPSATDGYWLLLAPLTKGRHTLKFGGRYNSRSDSFGKMVQDIEYDLEVR